MYIVMHCGGMPFNGETIETQSLGGSESSAYYLSAELAKKGHKVTLFTNHPDEGIWNDVQYRYAGQVSEQAPLGDRYQVYAVATPHDVNIVQRQPDAYRTPVAAKVSCLWIHDVPQVQFEDNVKASMLNADLILTVSEWQRQKVIENWGINKDNVRAIGNGIDLSLFAEDRSEVKEGFNLIYSSRPERGLETLVRPGGIMEALLEKLPEAHLNVCNYQNTTEYMQSYYSWLYERCEALPNVTIVGHLTKNKLAALMQSCDLLAYPTTFEETSCITAMEAMASGLPILSSYTGALPETCEGAGAVLLPLVPAGIRPGMMEAGDHNYAVDDDVYVEALCDIAKDDSVRRQMIELQLKAAKNRSWGGIADRACDAIVKVFEKTTGGSLSRHLMRTSDIYALEALMDSESFGDGDIECNTELEYDECYAFTKDAVWDDHYADYYEYEKERGVDYGPESLEDNHRFEYVASLVGRLPAGSRVVDYGCAHGHYTINLAQRYPDLNFIGIDITQSGIDKANDWKEKSGIENVLFRVGRVENGAIRTKDGPVLSLAKADAVIAAEVLEHVSDPQSHIDVLGGLLNDKDHARMIITVPYGPWEALGYEQHWPWRAHVHHFERSDLEEMCGHFKNYAVTVVSSGRTERLENIGSYVASFSKPDTPAREISYSRKLSEQSPRQTLSVCMIVKDAESSIRSSIKSISSVADEVIVSVDETTMDDTYDALMKALDDYCPHIPIHVSHSASALEVGFDAARNTVINKASGDWILWIDADEVLEGADNLSSRLRNNPYNSYGIPHHHFSLEPAGVLKTDYPSRVFRNHKGIRFFGMVHEHPETELNKGIEHTVVLPDVAIAHYGYQNEDVRRKRFDRNLPLLIKDRQTYPDRYLGKFLWIRDLFQQTQYEIETGYGITKEHIARADEAAELWEDLLCTNDAPLRLCVESLQWYGGMQKIIGVGKEYGIGVKTDAGECTADGWFRDHVHANMLAARMMREAEG